MTNATTSSNRPDHGDDMRYRFTEAERIAVKELKEACDKEGVQYKNLFDLAKYVLVSHSVAEDSNPKAAEIRLQAALKKIRKRNNWMEKKGLQDMNPRDAFSEIYKGHPEYFISNYAFDKEGRVVSAVAWPNHPLDYMLANPTHFSNFLVSELFKWDLAAANMEEARNGICIVFLCHGKMSLKGGLRYLRFLSKTVDMVHDMHSNRLKQILFEVPPVVAKLVRVGKRLLPAKIAARVNCVASVSEAERHLVRSSVSGQRANEWMQERYEIYQETLAKLTL